MLNNTEFRSWCMRLGLSETARATVALIRSCNPARCVGSARVNQFQIKSALWLLIGKARC